MNPHPLSNWIPYQLSYDEQGKWLLFWLDLEHRRMKEPFFEETIQISRYRNIERSRLKSCSDPEFLTALAPGLPHLKPTAFIFHISRCGSTLLTQAFCEAEEHIVIAEAPLLDEILRANEKDPELGPAQQEEWFKAALQLMGQLRNFKESDLIIKLDSWHLHFYTLLRNWFPDVPFIFLFRKPEEVLASHEKRRGIHSIPDMLSSILLGIDPAVDYNTDFNRYTADVIEQYFLKLHLIHQQKHPLNFFADYGDGIGPMVSLFTRATGIKVRNPDQLKTRLNYHSKSPDEIFKGDLPPNPKFSYPHCTQAYEELRARCLPAPYISI